MKNFHIITEIDSQTIYFDTANTREEANAIMHGYLDSEDPQDVKIYERDPDREGYSLVKRVTHQHKEERRLVGFGRW